MLIPLLALPRLILPHISSPAIIWSRGLPITRAKMNMRSISPSLSKLSLKTASIEAVFKDNFDIAFKAEIWISHENFNFYQESHWYAQTQFISNWLWLVEALKIRHHVPAFFSRHITRIPTC